ncbi:MAG: DNA translocase FtsK [Chitinispirillia bacterium]|nr:DNA translocase FtsK [Chitinispirillia bacterium]MCL2242565.1 DNA translocase FtsK [Chitinispirillia bacterium]
MARKRPVRTRDKSGNGDKPKPGLDRVIIQGIWGLIYTSTGVLMLISMLFYSPKQLLNGADIHILGPYLGTSLALGMFYLFGRLTAFAFPAAVCYIGAAKFMGRQLRMKLLLFLAVLTIELCLLLAVRHMPALNASGLTATANSAGSNYLGMFMVNLLVPLFKGRTFGPYFITTVLMVITVCVGLKVRPQTLWAFVTRWFMVLASWVRKAFGEVRTGIEESPDIVKERVDGDGVAAPVDGKQPNDKKSPPKKRDRKAVQVPEGEVPAEGDTAVSPEQAVGDDGAGGRAAKNGADDDGGHRELTPEEEAERLRGRIKIHGLDTQRMDAVKVEENAPDDGGIITEYNEGHNEADALEDVSLTEGESSGDILADSGNSGGGDINVNVFRAPSKPYRLPSPDVIADPPPLSEMVNEDTIYRNSAILEKTLKSFGIAGKVTDVSKGPVVTRYEMEIEAGTKVSRVVNLQNDISLAVGGLPVRIQAPIPGKAAIGIELPNPVRQNIPFKRILVSDAFRESTADIPVVIGSTISGGSYVTDIAKTPHLLIAGTTGSGKSVCMNSIICSMLMTKTPEELRLIMIDPKVVEMANFADIPHLLAPVVHDPKEAVKALQWGVNEMERRYKLIAKSGAKKLETFNERVRNGELADVLEEDENRPLPLIVIIIDELADLMMTASKDIEALIMRITQKARAAGIHLIVATQRPSVDIVTGKIKSNLPSRIGFRTVQAVDSRTILDRIGAEKLLGQGDMLFLRNGATDIERYHGAFISEKEVDAIVNDIKSQGVETEKITSFHDVIRDEEEGGEGGFGAGDGDRDPLFFEAARMTVQIGQGSTSLLQTRMKIGFARARRIMDEMEQAGIVGPSKGGKVREVLISAADLADIV